MNNISEIPTINLKGKQYTEVKDRVMFFRMDEQYKGWRLITKPHTISATEAIFSCEIYNKEDVLMATGYAHEVKGQGNVNKTSHLENCETSAVGRALGFLGIGIVGGIATAENIAQVSSKDDLKCTSQQQQELRKAIGYYQLEAKQINEHFIISTMAELPASSFNEAMALIKQLGEAKKGVNQQ